ncbi:MAG: hypothetical protein M3Z64_10545, partial [Verrucomicrobiota bacterium]|nr:hypothetical protein [Verrucomicrobiota bacterium]
MKVVPASIVTPRLLSSAALPHYKVLATADPSRARLVGSSIFGGNALYIFAGIFLGSALLSLGGYAFYSHRNHSASLSAPVVAEPTLEKPSAAPVPEISPQALHLTSIALGEPRLAVVDGKQLAENDTLTVTIAGRSSVLRVVT